MAIPPITPVTLEGLTEAKVDGTGVFDVLMKANKVHLDQEFVKNRIKGPEYATVYLGSLTTVMNTATQFLLNRDKVALEAQLVEQQILLAQIEVIKATAAVAQIEAQTALTNAQILNAAAELAILQANVTKIPAEISLLNAQAGLAAQQDTNLVAESLNIPKQGALLDQQKTNLVADLDVITANVTKIGNESALITEQKSLIAQQKLNLIADGLNIPKQGTLIDKQVLDVVQKTLNAVEENAVLVATACKLKGEFDLIVANKAKTDQESALLLQKVATERAQVTSMGVDTNSVIGRQKDLFLAQTKGFKSDAIQKATKIMVDTWNTRRMTDEGTSGNAQNSLRDEDIGLAIKTLNDDIAAI